MQTRERYPYTPAAGSCIMLAHGQTAPLERGFRSGRIPTVACGANRSPDALRRKFRDFPAGTQIPLETGILTNHQTVLAAFLGASQAGVWIPATPMRRPGHEEAVFLAWLTPMQLRRMNETERLGSEYDLEPAKGEFRSTEDCAPIAEPLAYFSRHGALASADGLPIPLSRPGAQDEGLARAMQLTGFTGDPSGFTQACRSCARRYAFDEAMQQAALPVR